MKVWDWHCVLAIQGLNQGTQLIVLHNLRCNRFMGAEGIVSYRFGSVIVWNWHSVLAVLGLNQSTQLVVLHYLQCGNTNKISTYRLRCLMLSSALWPVFCKTLAVD